ncbi:MAG: phenylacetaldoxime dehydratase family protein, partial [Bradyrhizobium sp.]|nr:phenylacetaldoxime dehydratase family protein [Bradyrhizobium sp.]
MESAIPPHLITTRCRHRRVDDDYKPPYPSFVARHGADVSRVVMAYFGVQYRAETPAAASTADFMVLVSRADGPSHWDLAHYVDQAGFANDVFVAYWDDVVRFDSWFEPARAAWTGPGAEGG